MSKQNKVNGTNQHFSNIHKYTLLILILCGLIVAFAWGIIAFLDAKNGEFDAASSRTVTYSANGGTVQGGTSQTVTEGSSFVLPSVSKTGYHGATWQDSTASTNPLKPSGTVGSSGTVGYSSSRVGSPSGTAISSSSNLRSMTKDGTYYLTTDIDCGTWSPLFTSSSNAFTGTLDGQGHTITLGISGSYQYCGFFGYINGATIKNVRLTGVNINISYSNDFFSNLNLS